MIDKDPRSEASIATASGWLRNCLDNHISCNPSPELRKPPKRLINIGNETRDPFLAEMSPASQNIKWFSLSYCWGEEPSMKLTKDSMDTLRNGISLSRLDPTIRDAIFITRALDIPYIWIDALCIVQDEQGKEWNEDASRMNEIYGGATATLVVASSSTVKDGFLKERQPQYIPVPLESLEWEAIDAESPVGLYLSQKWDSDEDSAEGPWSSRGWTMQEALLSSRLLYYTSSQMKWKCCEEERFERGTTKALGNVLTLAQRSLECDGSSEYEWLWDIGTFMKFKRFSEYLPSHPANPLRSEGELFLPWYDIIKEYSPRSFTNIGDRLVALSGLAKVFGNTIRCDEYVAGLWRPDLIRGLMWYTEGAMLIPRDSPQSMRAVNNIFPSWSWASIGFELVLNHQTSPGRFQALSRVDSIQIDLVDQCQPFGAVKSGRITLTGPLKRMSRLYNKAWQSADVSMPKLERHLSEIVEMESPEGVISRYSSPPGGHFAAVQMLAGEHSLGLLVLEATGEVSNGVNVYRRVGILILRYSGGVGTTMAPTLSAVRQRAANSLSTRLGPQHKGVRIVKRIIGEVLAELNRESWGLESVIIT